MLRVLIALNSYEEDGPGNLLLRLCQRWVPTPGIRIATVALSRSGPLAERFRHLGVGTELVESRGTKGLGRLREWARSLAARSDRPAVVHSHLLWPDLALRLVHDELDRIPLLSTCHGLHALDEKGRVKGLVYRGLERATRERCAAWVAVSEHVREGLLEAGYPPEKVFLIRNGVDCVQTYTLSEHRKRQIREYMNVPPDAPLIGAAGALRHLKGHDVLLRAMPGILALHPQAHLFLFGDGPCRGELEELARSLGIAGRVRMVGPLSTMLPQIFSTLDVVVHPSRTEAFGLVVAEAQACGTPVVASRTGGIPEAMVDGQTGFLVEPGSPGQIVGKVNQLLADPELRAAMGEAGRAFVRAEREIGTTAEGYVELWHRVTGARHTGDTDTGSDTPFDKKSFELAR